MQPHHINIKKRPKIYHIEYLLYSSLILYTASLKYKTAKLTYPDYS